MVKGLKKIFSMRRTRARDSRRGALSLEMLGVIAIIATIATSGIYYLNIMRRDTNVTDTIAAMELINTKVSEIYNNEPNYNGLTAELFIGTGNAPSNMVNNDRNGLKSPWGEVTLEPDGGDETFALTFENVPQDVCQRLGAVLRNSTAWQSLETDKGTYDITQNEGENMASWLSDNCQKGLNKLKFVARQQ